MLRLIVVICSLALSTPAAHADVEGVRNGIVLILREDGYSEIRISRTLLGRMRFVATRPDARREIVVNPNSGVVLRDYVRFFEVLEGSSSGSGQSSNGGGGEEEYDDDDDEDDDNSGSDDDDEDGDDNNDDEDGDKDDDNSGSGSSNSGSGGDDDDD